MVVRDFASLNLESGIWQLRISRRAGRAALCVPYQSERPAKKHLERWVQYHWQTVGGFFVGDTDPRGRGGRSESGTYYGARMHRYIKDYYDLYAPHLH